MKQTYSEKLKHPKWQKKRLEILQRDGFKCTMCGDTETELHINHLKYTGEPYEAPNEDLETLCKDCHLIKHKYNGKIFDILKLKNEIWDNYFIVTSDIGISIISILGNNVHLHFGFGHHDRIANEIYNASIGNDKIVIRNFSDYNIRNNTETLTFDDFGGKEKMFENIKKEMDEYGKPEIGMIVAPTRYSHSFAIEMFELVEITKTRFVFEYVGGGS